MDMEQMRCFTAAVECPTFLEAAERLHISQSSLSKQLQKLQEELGISLFEKKGRVALPTAAGKIFYGKALTMLKMYDETLESLAAYRESSVCTIGVLPVVTQYGLNGFLETFQKSCSQYTFQWREGEETELAEAFEKGEIQGAILRRGTLSPKKYAEQELAWDRMVAVVKDDMPLAGKRNITWEEAAKYPLLLMNPYTGIHRLCMDRLKETGLPLRVERTGRMETLLGEAAMGKGICILPEKSLALFRCQGLSVLPIVPVLDVPLVLAVKKGSLQGGLQLLWKASRNK